MANEKYFEIVQKINELTSTMSDAFDHIVNVQIPDLKFQDSFYLLNDVVEAFLSISNALKIFQDEFDVEKIEFAGARFRNSLEKLITLYEYPNQEAILQEYTMNVIPNYKNWRKELDLVFKMYSN